MTNCASIKPLLRTAGVFVCHCALLIGLAAWSTPASANTITSTLLGSAPANEPTTESVAPVDLNAELEAAKKAAAIIENSPNYAAEAPPTATDEELKLRRYYVLERVRAIESQIRSEARLKELNLQMDSAREAMNSWTTLEQRPPYPVTLVDELVREKLAAESRVQAQETRGDLVRAMRDTVSRAVKGLAVTIRQKEEQLASSNATRKAALAWPLELDRQRLRTSSAIAKSLESAQKINEIELATAELMASLAARKVDLAQSDSHFSETDYKVVQSRLNDESKSIARELSLAGDAEADATRRLEQSTELLAQKQALAASDPTGNESATIEKLKQAAALAELEASGARSTLDILRFKPLSIELQRAIWDYRYRLYGERSAQLVAEAKKNLAEISDRLQQLKLISERQTSLLRTDMGDRAQMLRTTADHDKRELMLRAQELDLKRDEALRNVAAAFGATQYLLSRATEELGLKGKGSQWGSGAISAYFAIKEFLQDAWNLELIAIEDTIDVEGRKVTGYTSITLGKILRAIFLFVGGVFLSLWLSRLAETFVVKRFGYDPTQARILRKWINTAGLGILLVAVLIWVRIPLTVFAFLGGAVAIGLGFGMQNLLKNLISGLMLLFERPFRAGDFIEVGPTRGNVVEIGIRSSVIRDVNGVDTLIPNNTFVEQSVTNWTYESAKVRFCIRVGVAYGSPVREVAQILADCVSRHGLILKDPTPEILFENFGADSLEFAIYYWLEIGPTVSNRLVSSALRFIIEKALRENDISISFPQRDVHLDVAGPLKVQIAREE